MSAPEDHRYPATTFPVRDGFVTSKDNAPAYWFYDTLWVILADVHQTGGSFSLLEQWMRAGVGPPLHVHNVDEWFFVFSGSMNMQLSERTLVATAGDSVWIPRGTDHGFTSAANSHPRISNYPTPTPSVGYSTTTGPPSAPTAGPTPHPDIEPGSRPTRGRVADERDEPHNL